MDIYTNNNIEYPYSLITHNIRVSVRTNFLNDQSDEDNNLFYGKKPFASWVLDDTTCQWKAPIDAPDVSENSYYWVETLYQSDNTKGWVKVDRS